MTRLRRRVVVLGALSLLANGCATPRPPSAAPVEILMACELDVQILDRCTAPSLLPLAPADAVAVLYEHLARCVVAAQEVRAAAERRVGGS